MAARELETVPYDSFAEYWDLCDLDRATEKAFFAGLIGNNAGSLLDLGCGTGTITIPLAQNLMARRGSAARAVGIDYSKSMLAIARQRDPRVEWICKDIRAVQIEGTFDFIMSCYNTLQTIVTDADLLRVFEWVRTLMHKETIFAFDVYQPNVDYLRSYPSAHVVRSFRDKHGRALEVWEGGVYDEEARIFELEWRLVEKGDSSGSSIAQLRVHHRQYFASEIDTLLTEAHLVVRKRYGDYDGSPSTPSSRKQLVVCGLA
jgi:SAM-dependent methyltransferase